MMKEEQGRSRRTAGCVLLLASVLTISFPAWSEEISGRVFVPTYISETGNRLVDGSIDLARGATIEIAVPGIPVWILGRRDAEGGRWLVVLADGKRIIMTVPVAGPPGVQSFTIETLPERSSQPPVLVLPGRAGPGAARILDMAALPPGAYQGASLSHPIAVPRSGEIVGPKQLGVAGAPLLPDGRLIVANGDVVVALTEPSQRYAHGILGDGLEATGFVSLRPSDTGGTLVGAAALPDPAVFETLAPLAYDMDGDGLDELVLTTSDNDSGAGLQLYSVEGELLAESQPIGIGHRWNHVIAAGPFGPTGEIEIAAVRTPHIGGVLEYYRWQEGALLPIHRVRGYSTHSIGSRNLDMAVAGDFDDDGRIELLLPNQSLSRLVLVKRTAEGSVESARVDLEGRLSSNIGIAAGAAAETGDSIAVAFGTTSGAIYIIQ